MHARMRLQVAAALIVAGCGTVRSTTAPNTDLRKYSIYSLVRWPGRVESMTEQTVDSSLRGSLAARGLTEATPGQAPDFLVRYRLTTQQPLSVEPVGYGLNATATQDVSGYTRGTLVIEFIDPRTNQTFWRGTANDVVNRPDSPDSGTISRIVRQIVSRYPTLKAGSPGMDSPSSPAAPKTAATSARR